jgi:protein ImuB
MTTRRLLSLVLPHLAAEAARKRLRPPGAAPLATYAMVKGAARLASLCPRAAALDLRAGQALTDARALRPTLLAVEADAAEDAARLARIADWCRRWTPLAAIDADCAAPALLLDVGGATHLFGGEENMAREIETAFRAQGFSARVCVAASAEAARALARFTALHVAPEGRGFERLTESLPLAALELSAETLDALRRAGLKRVGDVRRRPRAPVAARFGPLVHARLDGLDGLTLAPISPRFEAAPYLLERRFAEPLAQEEAIFATLARLCVDLCAMLTRHGEGARALDADFFRVDGVVKHLAAGAARATRDPGALARLFRERLAALDEEGLETGYGFDVIRLSARRVERLDAAQTRLDAPARRGDLAHLVDRLGARLGPHRVMRLVAPSRHLPEQAGGLAPLARPAPPRGEAGVAGGDLLPARPLRLFERPEPVEAMALAPDGPPLRFRWRRMLHEVAAAEGPERIACDWRAGLAPTRDYYRVEDREGRRFWLYREGLLGLESARASWFAHGVFG